MIIYHGTNINSAENIRKRGILLERCNDFTDFGKGFYTSKTEEFAKDTAINKCLKSKKYGVNIAPAIVIFEFDENMIKKTNYLYFDENDEKWLQFIVNNRNGWNYTNYIVDNFHNLNASYDIVEGGIADGNIVEYAESCRIRNVKVSDSYLQSILYSDKLYAHQISFHTEKVLDFLHFVEYKEVAS